MKKEFFILCLLTIIYSCDNSSSDSIDEDGISIELEEEWLIPLNEVKDGGVGRDGIPSIDEPEFITDAVIDDEELVVGIYFEGEARAYPHYILDWHEVVNDVIGNDPITLNYCPLTGTAFVWGRAYDGAETTFGVSGLLYNNNLIMYDRETQSLWSQLKLQCVNGELVGNRPETYNIVETTWGTWKSLYPKTVLLSEDTGYSRNYDEYPYGDYLIYDDYLFFLPAPHDRRLANKERVYTIIDNEVAKAYRYQDFVGGKAIIDSFNEKEYLVVGNENVINSFVLTQDNEGMTFAYDLSISGGFFKDNLGTVRNIFGHPITGNLGEYLTPAVSVVSYWFAVGAFYPDLEIYNQ